MHPAAALAFARLAQEYAAWRSVETADRSEAPGWWWSTALALRGEMATLPAEGATLFGLAEGASYAEAAESILALLRPQTRQPWPDDFPKKPPHPARDEAASESSAAQASAAAVPPMAGS